MLEPTNLGCDQAKRIIFSGCQAGRQAGSEGVLQRASPQKLKIAISIVDWLNHWPLHFPTIIVTSSSSQL